MPAGSNAMTFIGSFSVCPIRFGDFSGVLNFWLGKAHPWTSAFSRHRRALRVSCIEHNLVAFPGDNGWFQASVQQKTGEYQVSFLCLTEGALNKSTTVKTLKKHTNNYNFKFSLNLTSTNTGKTVRNLMCMWRSDDIHMHVTFLCKITLCNLVVK